jgi:hypothetical protein
MPIRTEVTTIRAGASLDPGGLKRYRYFEAILDVASNLLVPERSSIRTGTYGGGLDSDA